MTFTIDASISSSQKTDRITEFYRNLFALKFYFRIFVYDTYFMNKILFVVCWLFLLSFSAYSADYYDSLSYDKEFSEPIKWYPEQSIHTKPIQCRIYSDYGKIYYLIENSLSEYEPVAYEVGIFLKGSKGNVKDYEVVVLLESDDGRVELFSKRYRIDLTENPDIKKNEKKKYYEKNIEYSYDSINLSYDFSDAKYGVAYGKRKIEFPFKLTDNAEKKSIITLNGVESSKTDMFVSVSYQNGPDVQSDISLYSIDMTETGRPSFGNFYWGQVYKQNYKIKIKPAGVNDKIYYWLREFHKDELIFAPPSRSKIELWNEYAGAIELVSKYGSEGAMGIAAFSVGMNNKPSEIAGPYYFRVEDREETFTQVFMDEKIDYKREIAFNDKKFNEPLLEYGMGLIRFNSFSSDDKFYFNYKSANSVGRSDNIPCEGEYKFVNNDVEPYKLNFFYSNGETIGEVVLFPANATLPILKNEKSKNIYLNSDKVIEFYMPKNAVRYSVTADLDKELSVDSKSPEFKGRFNVVADGDEAVYKLRFGAFEDNGALKDLSDYYYIYLNKNVSESGALSEGIDFETYHNSVKLLTLNCEDKKLKIFYKIGDAGEWMSYRDPVEFHPPLYGVSFVKIFVKSVDTAGNERVNPEPFILKFDRRGLFVDKNAKLGGNGTEKSPFNSLFPALVSAKKNNLKIIYLINDEIDISVSSKISTDIIIQPYKKGERAKIVFDTKNSLKKEEIWFDVTAGGFFEARNLDLDIVNGGNLIKTERTKTKLYDISFNYKGEGEFLLLDSFKSKIGVSGCSLEAYKSKKVGFINAVKSEVILRAVKSNVASNDVDMLNFDKSKKISIEGFYCDITCDNSVSLIKSDYSEMNLTNIIINLNGSYKRSSAFLTENSAVNINESDFIFKGDDPFEIKVMDDKNSKIIIENSLFKIDKSVGAIGFNQNGGTLLFAKSALDINGCSDYAYSFRNDKSKLRIESSVVRNQFCESSLIFSLNNGVFEGINNSIFSNNVVGSAYGFWITGKVAITTINSFYYFSENIEKCGFIFVNNDDMNRLKPIWNSNAISERAVFITFSDNQNGDTYVADYKKTNYFCDFKDSFAFERNDFFIPTGNSPLLGGGIGEDETSIKIPKYDFFGNDRLFPGNRVDVGAAQITGYIK